MPLKVPAPLLQRVEDFIGRYSLLASAEVAVATSGGKDSIFACLVLRELGFTVTPVIVDMEFSPGWGEIVGSKLQSLQFHSAIVINAREIGGRPAADSERSGLLHRNLLALDAITTEEIATEVTPCTSCYNSKVLAIEDYFDHAGFTQVVFAHHATDAVTSFLKSALMYIDRWDENNVEYDRGRFSELCRTSREKILQGDHGTLLRLKQLAESGFATTDEPPRQFLRQGADKELIRPLLEVWEFEIEGFVSEAGLHTEPSGCGHSMSPLTQTPRELTQYEIVRALEPLPLSANLLELAMYNVDNQGRLVSNARRDRDDLLGTEYKKSYEGLTKL